MHSMRALKSYKDVTKFLLYYLKARCHSLGRIVRKMKDGAVVMTCDFFIVLLGSSIILIFS